MIYEVVNCFGLILILWFIIYIYVYIFLVNLLGIDRVFGCECPTRQVYEEAAKEVTLSAVNGINCELSPFHSFSAC